MNNDTHREYLNKTDTIENFILLDQSWSFTYPGRDNNSLAGRGRYPEGKQTAGIVRAWDDIFFTLLFVMGRRGVPSHVAVCRLVYY